MNRPGTPHPQPSPAHTGAHVRDHSHCGPDGWRDHAANVVREAGLRLGGGRAAVVDVLAGEHCVLGAQEIADRLADDGRPGANLATVYRTLDTLRALRLVQRLDTGDGIARYERIDPCGEHHHHVLHPDGSVTPFHDDALEREIQATARRLGLELAGHEIVLHASRGQAAATGG